MDNGCCIMVIDQKAAKDIFTFHHFVTQRQGLGKMFLILDSHQLNLRFKKKMELPPIDTRSKGMWNFTDSLAYLCSNKLNGENEREV